MSVRSTCIAFVLSLLLGVTAGQLFANESPSKRSRRQTQLRITAKAWGPSQLDVDAAKARVLSSAQLRSWVDGTKYRFIGFEFIEREEKSGRSLPPTHFRTVYYDYTNDRTLVATGDFAGKEPVTVSEGAFQPVASPRSSKRRSLSSAPIRRLPGG